MFDTYHPIVTFLYFIVILLMILFSENIIILTFWILGAILFLWSYRERRRLLKETFGIFLLIGAMMIINPMVSHNGVTVLFFMNGKAVTLEAMVYGGYIGLLLSAMLLWCSCYNEVMTSDKLIYIFGRIMPHLALAISMTMRLIPLFKRKASEVYAYQKISMKKSKPSYVDKILLGVKTFSIIMTWSFENALDTADSMKARGYGIRKRTSYSLYRFTCRDAAFLMFLIMVPVITILLWRQSDMQYTFYPAISYPEWDSTGILIYGLCGGIAGIPWIFEVKEKIIWKFYRFGI